MRFAPAPPRLGASAGAQVAEAPPRRQTEAAGAILVAWQEQEVALLERECPPAPAGPAKQFFSADGAFVPLLHGEWAEVKTLALGEIGAPEFKGGEWVAPTRELSYFSRLADADTFGRLALIETQRRGGESAGGGAGRTRGLSAEAGSADAVSGGSGAGLADRQRAGGKCQQAGGGSAVERGGDAWGARPCGPDAGAAQCGLQRSLGGSLGADRAGAAGASWPATGGTAAAAGASRGRGGRGGGRRPGRPRGARQGRKARRGREAEHRRGRRAAAARRGSPPAPLPHPPRYPPPASRDDARQTITHTPKGT